MRTAAVHVRVDPVTKAQVEAVLSDLGMTPTTAKPGDAAALAARLRTFTDGQAMQEEGVDTIRAMRDEARY